MKRTDLIKRGELNISDAFFVRETVIPHALEAERWNIVVFEAFRVVELVLKGMMCLAGYAPRESHELAALLADFQDIVSKQQPSVPFLYAIVAPGGDSYGLRVHENSIWLLKRVGATYTALGSSGTHPIQTEQLLRLRLERQGNLLSVFVGDELFMRVTDDAIASADRIVRTFTKQPDSVRIARLTECADRLRSRREIAFFGTKAYSRSDADAAVVMMNQALDASKTFLVHG